MFFVSLWLPFRFLALSPLREDESSLLQQCIGLQDRTAEDVEGAEGQGYWPPENGRNCRGAAAQTITGIH